MFPHLDGRVHDRTGEDAGGPLAKRGRMPFGYAYARPGVLGARRPAGADALDLRSEPRERAGTEDHARGKGIVDEGLDNSCPAEGGRPSRSCPAGGDGPASGRLVRLSSGSPCSGRRRARLASPASA